MLNKDSFVFVSFGEQVLLYCKSNNDINYSELARKILSEMNLDDIISLMDILSKVNQLVCQNLYTTFREMRVSSVFDSKYYFGFVTKICLIYCDQIDNARVSLNEGDFIAYLLGLRSYIERIKEYDFLDPIYNNIDVKIKSYIAESIAVLKVKLYSQSYLPIENAIYLFFLEDKLSALNKLQQIVLKDSEYRHNKFEVMEYLTKVDMFFVRISYDYIPKISFSSDAMNLLFSEEETSISKKELREILDYKDFFRKDFPLKNTGKRLILNKHFISSDREGIVKLFDKFFYIEYNAFYNKEPKWSFGRIFFSNISEPFSGESVNDLILIRDCILEMMNDKQSEVKLKFFSLVYHLNETQYFTGITNLLPEILEEYFLRAKGFSKQTIKNFLLSDKDRNPVALYDFGINFIKTSSISTGINMLDTK